jgi:hypothetical protein
MNRTESIKGGIRPPRIASRDRRPANGEALDSCTLTDQLLSSSLSSTGSRTGARQLMLGVLEDAIANWFHYRRASSTRGKRLFNEVQEWVSSDDRSWLYSFANICEHLDLDPDYLRARLIHRPSNRAGWQRPVLQRPSGVSGAPRGLAA